MKGCFVQITARRPMIPVAYVLRRCARFSQDHVSCSLYFQALRSTRARKSQPSIQLGSGGLGWASGISAAGSGQHPRHHRLKDAGHEARIINLVNAPVKSSANPA